MHRHSGTSRNPALPTGRLAIHRHSGASRNPALPIGRLAIHRHSGASRNPALPTGQLAIHRHSGASRNPALPTGRLAIHRHSGASRNPALPIGRLAIHRHSGTSRNPAFQWTTACAGATTLWPNHPKRNATLARAGSPAASPYCYCTSRRMYVKSPKGSSFCNRCRASSSPFRYQSNQARACQSRMRCGR